MFFPSLGVLADLRAIDPTLVLRQNLLDGVLVAFILALTLVAVVTKVIGCGLPARLAGMSRRDAWVVGFGMSPHGEVAMVVALVGLEAGLFGQPSYVALLLMSLITSFISPLLLLQPFCDPSNDGASRD